MAISAQVKAADPWAQFCGVRGRTHRGLVMPVIRATADDVRGVRLLLGESQKEFLARFSVTSTRCIRYWETWGVCFHRENWLAWREACRAACQSMRANNECG